MRPSERPCMWPSEPDPDRLQGWAKYAVLVALAAVGWLALWGVCGLLMWLAAGLVQ